MHHESAGPADRLSRLRAAVAQRPDSARAHLNLGATLAELGAIGEAEQAFRRALELEPGMPEALVNLGGVHLARWDFKSCVEVNRQAAQARPDFLHAHYNQGLGHLYLGEAVEMHDCFRRVLELDPRHPGGRYFMAVALNAIGQVDEARKHLAIAIELGYHPEPEFLRALERAGKDAVPVLELGENRETGLPQPTRRS
jgi:Flp pilus assembly protein TadD